MEAPPWPWVAVVLVAVAVLLRERLVRAWRVAWRGPRPADAALDGCELDACAFCGAPDSSAVSHGELTVNLRRHGLLTSGEAVYAFSCVDRSDFVDDGSVRRGLAYADAALPFASTGAQISAPHVHAAALDLVVAHAPRARTARARTALDVGSGTGIFGALLAEALDCEVTCVEHASELVAHAAGALRRHARRRRRTCAVTLHTGCARAFCAAAAAPTTAHGASASTRGVARAYSQ